MKALNTLLGVKMETFSFLPHGCLHSATPSLASGFLQSKCSKKECMPKMKASLFNNLILGCHILYVRNESLGQAHAHKGGIKFYLLKGGMSAVSGCIFKTILPYMYIHTHIYMCVCVFIHKDIHEYLQDNIGVLIFQTFFKGKISVFCRQISRHGSP